MHKIVNYELGESLALFIPTEMWDIKRKPPEKAGENFAQNSPPEKAAINLADESTDSKKGRNNMADLDKNLNNPAPESNPAPEGNPTPEGDSSPTVEELMVQLAQQKAAYEKLKLANDKNSSQASELRKQLQAKLTAKEQEEAAKREAEEQHNAYVRELETYKAKMESKDRHLAMGMNAEMADEAAQLEIDSDRDDLTNIYKKFFEETKAAQRKADEIEFKTRPDPANGGTEEDAFLKGFNSTRPKYY